MDTKIDEQLLGEAARWSARLSAHDCSEAQYAEFESWHSANSAHRDAFARVRATAAIVDRQLGADKRLQLLAEKAFAAGSTIATADLTLVSKTMVTSGQVACESATIAGLLPAPPLCAAESPSAHRRHSRFRPLRAGVALAMAASFTMVALVAWRTPAHFLQTAPVENQTAELQAPSQAARHVTLADGTLVHLDAGSKVRVVMSAHERRVQLQAGRAYFEVAHDSSRPFSVSANGTRTVALGTKFQVQQRGNDTVVTLTQGSVAVSGNEGRWQERLRPGEQLKIVAGNDKPELNVVDTNDITSWSRGWLVFKQTPLTEALSEINRYSEKKLVIADATLSDLSVAGSFIAGDAQSIVDAIAAVLPIRVVDGGQHEILLFRRYDN
jgi:transmembrane sensor